MDAKRIADKYIGPRGGKPKRAKRPQVGKPVRASCETVTLPIADYKALLEAAQSDAEFTACENCGAWLFECEDGVYIGDVVGCEYFAYGNDERFRNTCRRYRSGFTS